MAWTMAALYGVLLTGQVAPGTLELTFRAADERLNTGLFVKRGERVEITAKGSWSMWGGHYGRSNALGHRYRVGSYGWGYLMARVGVRPEVAVGTHASWVSPSSGLLILYPNTGDRGVRGGEGELHITIVGGRPVEEAIAAIDQGAIRVMVPADSDAVLTDIYIDDRDELRIDAFGEWRMYDGGPLLTPDGDPRRTLSPGIPWGRLVARIGGPTFGIGRVYPVGSATVFRPEPGGLLYLMPHVRAYRGQRRSGSLEVVVRGGRRASPKLLEMALRRATDYERGFGFLRIHQYRQTMGLPPAFCSPALMRAAQAHAEYLARHGASGHREDPKQPGFTGATPAERAAAQRFAGNSLAENIHGYTDGAKAVDGLWRTVYHRLALVDPAARAYGVGVAKGRRTAYVVLCGVPTHPPADHTKLPDVVTYPINKQVNVPPSWSGLESPSPLPEGTEGPVGFPISASLTRSDLESVVSAGLQDGRGRNVPCYLLAPNNDDHERLRATAFLIPRRPLRPLTSYACRMVLKSATGEFPVEWWFTTGSEDSPTMPPPAFGSPANPPLDFGRSE